MLWEDCLDISIQWPYSKRISAYPEVSVAMEQGQQLGCRSHLQEVNVSGVACAKGAPSEPSREAAF